METDAEIARPVVGPIVAAARRLGLAVEEPVVLRSGANVVLHLTPTPVVARVATLTAEMRGGAHDYLRRERDISSALAVRGMPVIAPTDLVAPGPHEADGYVFLLLNHRDLQPVDLDSADDGKAVGRALVELLAALDELPPDIARGDEGQPWDEIERMMRTTTSTIDHGVNARIANTVDALRELEPDDPWRLVHGDAHRGNVAFTEQGVTWFDFEDANLRPLAWDLATLLRTWPAAGDEACRLLDVDPDGFSMRWHHELREVYALLWNLLYAKRYTRAQEPTAERLANWLARPDVLTSLRTSGS